MTRAPIIDQLRSTGLGSKSSADETVAWTPLDVLWGVARRNGYFDIEDPSAHAGLTQHAFPFGRDEEAICGYRPPRRRDEWNPTPRPMLALPSDAYNPRCDRCQSRIRPPWAGGDRDAAPRDQRPTAMTRPGHLPGMVAVPVGPAQPVAIPVVVPLAISVVAPEPAPSPMPGPELLSWPEPLLEGAPAPEAVFSPAPEPATDADPQTGSEADAQVAIAPATPGSPAPTFQVKPRALRPRRARGPKPRPRL
jgi:hypothetical protein